MPVARAMVRERSASLSLSVVCSCWRRLASSAAATLTIWLLGQQHDVVVFLSLEDILFVPPCGWFLLEEGAVLAGRAVGATAAMHLVLGSARRWHQHFFSAGAGVSTTTTTTATQHAGGEDRYDHLLSVEL